MPVDLILSGFFRSGTTVLWEAAGRANPRSEVFYEPCHEQLARQVRAFVNDGGQAHPVHNRSLWTAYARYPGLAEALHKARSSAALVPDIAAVERALSIFAERVTAPTILQVNRWGHLLPELHRRTGLPYVHILRNPTDVQASMRRYHRHDGRLAARWLKSVAWPAVRGRAFAMDRRFAELAGRGVIPERIARSHPPVDDRFLAVWLAENAGPVAAADGRHSIACVYEAVAADPTATRAAIHERLGFDLALDETFTRDVEGEAAWRHDRDRLNRFAERYGVTDWITPILRLVGQALRRD